MCGPVFADRFIDYFLRHASGTPVFACLIAQLVEPPLQLEHFQLSPGLLQLIVRKLVDLPMQGSSQFLRRHFQSCAHAREIITPRFQPQPSARR